MESMTILLAEQEGIIADLAAQDPQDAETHLLIHLSQHPDTGSGQLVEWLYQQAIAPRVLTVTRTLLLVFASQRADASVSHALADVRCCVTCWARIAQEYPRLALPPSPEEIIVPDWRPTHARNLRGAA